MGKTINKGPCYCCEASSSSSSVTSSVSSSTSSVTSSASGDFCCQPGGWNNGECGLLYTSYHDMGGGECGVFSVSVDSRCVSHANDGSVCNNQSDRVAYPCYDSFPDCVKEVICNIGFSDVFCGPTDFTNCFWGGQWGDGFDCIGTLDEFDTIHGACESVDTNEGSPCPTTDCECTGPAF